MYAHFRAGCVAERQRPLAMMIRPLPHAVAASIARCRDLPSTVAWSEARAAPWPPEVREEIWRDRVIFRRLLRGLRGKIAAAGRGTREKMRELVADPSLLSSSSSSLTAGRHVVAGAQIGTFLEDHFPGFYGTLLRKLLQQVVAFSTTGMRYDGTNPAEYAYEGAIAAANTGDIEDSTIYIRVSPCKKCCDEEDGALPYLESLISHDAAATGEETRALLEPIPCASSVKGKTVGAVISKSTTEPHMCFRSDRRLLRLWLALEIAMRALYHASQSIWAPVSDAMSCADGTKISHNPQARSSIVPAATLVDDTDGTAVRESLRHIHTLLVEWLEEGMEALECLSQYSLASRVAKRSCEIITFAKTRLQSWHHSERVRRNRYRRADCGRCSFAG